jgi:hypothetical protein|tara:strand:+ start:212 stop:589 length:378 start_codon:yes stop_codon:yes gene_type:complete
LTHHNITTENHAPSNRARQRVVLFEEAKARARFARRVGRAEVVLIDAVSGTDDDDDAREERVRRRGGGQQGEKRSGREGSFGGVDQVFVGGEESASVEERSDAADDDWFGFDGEDRGYLRDEYHE